ncbi:hypothetical protein GCM10009700_35220 [Brevibacterium sanguinis]|uniref:tail fiber domain-containing protein n=1 Tax=Brevibacterium sanguinis TaxID=232444 RepID=UPI0031E0282C
MSAVERLAREIYDTRRLALGHATHPQMGATSMEGGAFPIRDGEGNEVGRIGIGDDGSFVIDNTDGPKPPKPTMPMVSADAGMIRVDYDGKFADYGEQVDVTATQDLDRVEVHASQDPNFVPDRVVSYGGAYASLEGGSFTLGPLADAGAWYVRLVARSKAGKFSVPSDLVEVEVAVAGVDLEITNAWLTGEAAQTTADGKNAIFRGPDEPVNDPDNPFKVGDIWFEMTPDGKSIPNQWDGTQWVGVDDYRQSQIEKVQAELRKDLDAVIVDGTGTSNFYKPVAPDPADAKEGDLWFDSSEDGKNAVSILENGVWVKISDKRIEEIRQAQAALDAEITEVEARASAEAKSLADQARADAAADATSKADAAKDSAVSTAATNAAGVYGETKDLVSGWRVTGKTTIAGGVIETDSIKTAQLAAGSVTADILAAGSVITSKIATDAVDARTVKAGAIGAVAIAADAIEGRHVKAGTVSADRLLVTSGGNLVPWDQVTRGETVAPHGIYGTTGATLSLAPADATKSRPAHMIAKRTEAGFDYVVYLKGGVDKKIPASPGTEFNFSCSLYSDDAGAQARLMLVGYSDFTAANGSGSGYIGTIAQSSTVNLTSGTQTVTVKGVTQANAVAVIPWIQLSSGHAVGVIDPVLKSTVGATLIQDGAITTAKIATGAITADSGIIGSINAGVITVGEMDGARIKAGTISADKVLIGGDTNMLPNPGFAQGWAGWSPAGDAVLDTTGSFPQIKLTGTGSSITSQPVKLLGPVNVRVVSSFYATVLTAVGQKADGSEVTQTVSRNSTGTDPVSGYTVFEGGFVPPNDWVSMRVRVAPRSVFGGTANANIANVGVFTQAGATLIQDGAVITSKIATGAITAESGIIGSIDANTITVGKIMGNQIDADALNGKTITGALIRTASSGARVELSQNGLKQYNALGATLVDMTQGSFTVTGGSITGSTIKTATSGARVELDGNGLVQYDSGNLAALIMRDGRLEVRNQISVNKVGSIRLLGDAGAAGEGAVTVTIGRTANGRAEITGDRGSSYGPSTIAFERDGMVLSSPNRNGQDLYTMSRLSTGSAYFGWGSSTGLADNSGFVTAWTDSLILSGGGATITLDRNKNMVWDGAGIQSSAGKDLVLTTTSKSSSLQIKGGTTGNADFVMTADGWQWSGIKAGTGTGMNITGGGWIQKNTSSLRYKTDVKPADLSGFDVLSLEPKSFIYKDQKRRFERPEAEWGDYEEDVFAHGLPVSYGLIAEEVEAAGGEFVLNYDQEGLPDSINYGHLAVALIPVVREQRDCIANLEGRLRALEAA